MCRINAATLCVAVVLASSLAVSSQAADLQASPPETAPATIIEPTNQAMCLAESILHKQGERHFVGTISFDHAYEYAEAAKATVEQHGRLHVSANGDLRLDVYVDGFERPVVCCVTKGKAWAIFGDGSATVHQGTFPTSKDYNELPAHLRQLMYQAEQTVGWADAILNTSSLSDEDVVIEEAVMRDGKLLSSIRIRSPQDVPAVVFELVSEYSDQFGGYLPTEIRSEFGTKHMCEYVAVPGFEPLPTLIEVTSPINNSTWSITEITPEPQGREISPFDTLFAAPARAQEKGQFDHLYGRIVYDAEGNSEFYPIE